MNILHVGKYFWPFHGGLENYMRDLMLALGKQGVSAAALVHRHELSLRTLDEKMVLEDQSFRVVRTGTWARLFFTPISPAFPGQLRPLIRAFKPDLLHLHLPNPSAFWALALPSARRLPWVVHWHADVVTESQSALMKIAYALYRPFERRVLRRARAIVATSERYRESSKPLQPWLAKCLVVPLGMDAGRLAMQMPAKPSEVKHEPGIRVLAVGRLTYYKGMRYLIEATVEVANMQLDLVGDGDQANELRHLVAELNLQDRVTFHGTATDPELAQLMDHCDCLCLPSIERTEAFGMVLLEAMCFGKATVVSDVPGSGMGWIVDHGVTGLKVQPANAQALAAGFRKLAGDRQSLEAMGQRGKEKFDQMFEINRAAEGILEIYRSILEENSAARTGGSVQ